MAGASPAPRLRRVPTRTCVGCRQVRPKRALVRVVRTPQGEVQVDPTGKRAGRGAYVCPSEACLEKAFRGRQLERALDRPLDAAVHEALRQELARLAPSQAP